ncbi:hypothetical protein Q3O97_05455 [Ralstonia pseudosolanacearum]|uniref:hypothetical protein n=1 Tax=Ralstonia pseudosolanacearum TaxID=1310165 RepID=UPI00270DCB3D|nr:hypothetical protein [Ralstonia pseudosolanacearum]MDO3615286.1 hypothetical protein [Ralstonia pseudosolanacearum]
MHDVTRTDASRRLVNCALLVAAVVTLPSCASWSALSHYPTVPEYCPNGDTKAACKDLPFVAEQVRLAAGDAAHMTDAMKSELVASTATDVATFGLAAAFGVKLVHGNTLTNGAKNLALAAGASYVAGNLFFPRTTEQVQLATRSALMCVAARGNDLLGAYSTLTAQIEETSQQVPTGCHADAQYADLVRARDAARDALRSTRDSQVSLAQLLFRARLAAHDGLQAQLDTQRPNQDAYLAAGKSALTAAGSLASATASATTTGSTGSWFGVYTRTQKYGLMQNEVPVSACTDEDRKTMSQLKTTFEGYKQTLNEVVNAVADAGKDCLAATPTVVTPLSASQTSVTLHAGESGTVVVVSGGRPPLYADWVGTLPKDSDAGYSWLVANQQIRLAAPASAPGGTYTLRIRDSAARPANLDITVTTAK